MNFPLFLSFLLDNDSDTEIKGKANFPYATLKHSLTHTLASAFHRALLKYWKKIWNNKNIRCLILISSYFSLRSESGEGRRWAKTDGVEFFHFFFASAYIFLLPHTKAGVGRWSGIFQLSLFVTHNGKHITSMRGERKKEKFIKT